MLPSHLKRALIKACIHLLRLDERGPRLLDVFDAWPFVERRKEPFQAYWVGGDRRGEPPVLTFGLKFTITGCVMTVSAIAMLYASYGARQALLIIPVFIAYIYLVLFAQTIINGLKYKNQKA